MESRKQAVSIRMSAADIRAVKKLAKRFEVRDSDVIRFAVKSMLAKLSPLSDSGLKGRNLVPVFVETGTDIFRYLDIDAARLETIINEGAEPTARVDHEDIQLLAMSGVPQSYAMLRLLGIGAKPDQVGLADRDSGDREQLAQSLRSYLYEKYGYGARQNGLASHAIRGEPS
jgi:hypothetical protein